MPSKVSRLFQTHTFTLYDATIYKNKNFLFGDRTELIYQHDLWKIGEDPLSTPPQINIKQATKRLIDSQYQGPVILDLEQFNVYSSSQDRQTLLSIMRAIKQELPGNPIGNYAICPNRNTSAPMYPIDHAIYKSWALVNDSVKNIAEESDALFPSCYSMHVDSYRWDRYIVANIEEANRYTPKKPIYAFLMPVFHPSVPGRRLHYIDEEFFYHQLMTLYRLCDGIVIWWITNETFNVDFPWFKAVKKFTSKYI